MYARVVTLALLTMDAGFRLAAASAAPDKATQAKIKAEYLHVPMAFELNEGQSDPQVKALVRGSGYGLFLTSSESVFVVSPGKDEAVVRVRTLGSNPSPKVSGLDRMSSVSNYYVGKDRSKWRKNVANYARVKYDSIYPGVDLVYYGNQQQLEDDYVVAPGADPNSIQFAVDGVRKLRVDRDGDLRLETAHGSIYQHKPVIYQQVNGSRREIAGNFVVRGNQVSFHVGDCDRSKELVIDPSLVFLTYLGGSGTDQGLAITITSQTGFTVVGGSTSSANFPIVSLAGVTSYPYTGQTDGFLAILYYNAGKNQTNLIDSTYVGGTGGVNVVTSVALDSFEVPRFFYVAGYTTSPNFDVVNAAQPTYGGGTTDAWVAQLNNTITSFVPPYAITTEVGFATYLGGSGQDEITGIAVDQNSKDVFVTGFTTSTNFPTSKGVLQRTSPGGEDAFVARYASGCTAADNDVDGCPIETTPPGTRIFSTYLGGTGTDAASGIALGINSSTGKLTAYISGTTTSPSIPPAAEEPAAGFASQATAGSEGFLVALTQAGTATIFSDLIGSSTTTTKVNAVATDAAGNIYITGNTNDTALTLVGPIFKRYQGGANDAFIGQYGGGGAGHVFSFFG